ncbi:hypothetical protein [Jannaschia sp. LMIT008]|uniref:hypothetical protein n=1 Tax=Jannaschia maritima TaxID=3032585 RepID=UPI0028127B25|nr:hypothetical protein [Jannaschia sp. LMIT008]
MIIPSPLDVLRALPRIGLHLAAPAMVMGAVCGSLVDLLLGHSGYPLAIAGVVAGPVAFALAINALHRAEDAHRDDMADMAERYRQTQTKERMAAARRRGELIELNERRPARRGKDGE